MKFNYTSEKYHAFTDISGITFSRKLQNETAFDLIIKIYSMETSSINLNDFYYSSGKGIFLRMFHSVDSWPNTSLVFINLEDMKFEIIIQTYSSWNIWTATHVGGGKYSIAISPNQSVEYQTP
jgi:hypothetical protein